MKAVARETMYASLARFSGLALIIVCVLFQRRGLLDWSELVFLGVCVGLQESFLRLPKLRMLRTPMLVLYSMLPLALVLYHARDIHSRHDDFVQIILFTPLPLILVSVQIMVLYVRESARLVSVVLVLALFSTVIGVRRPLEDSVWPWLTAIGACASVFLMLQHPGMLFSGVYVHRRRGAFPPTGRPGGIMRGTFFSVLPLFTLLVLVSSVFLYFAIPRLEVGKSQPQGYQIGADPSTQRDGNSPIRPSIPHNGPGGRDHDPHDDDAPASVAGLASGVDLGDFGEIKRTTTPALDVRLVAPERTFVQQVYLRAFTYGTFDGYRWLPVRTTPGAIEEVADGDTREFLNAPGMRNSNWTSRRYEVTLREAGLGRTGELPMPTEPWALREINGALYYDLVSNMARAPMVKPGQSYEVMVNQLIASEGQLRRTLADSHPSSAPSNEYLQLPVGLREDIRSRFKFYDRYRAMAERTNNARATDRGAYACAMDIVKMFRDATAGGSKAWVYSLDFRPKPGPDAIARFLDTNTSEAERFGHCEYFASAMCVLLRCYGIPARVAAGFLASKPDDAGVFKVTGASAHAWVEVYFGSMGWVTFDPTPPEDSNATEHAGDNPTPDSADPQPKDPETATTSEDGGDIATAAADPFRSFDHEAQQQMFGDARDFLSGLISKLDNALSGLTDWMPAGLFPKSAIIRLALLVLPPLAVLLVWLVLRRNRKKIEARVLRQMGEGGKKRQRGLYFQLLLLLARYGFQKRVSETPREFALRVLHKGGDKHEPIVELTEIYYALRFGLDRELETEFKRELAKYSDALRSESSGPASAPQPA